MPHNFGLKDYRNFCLNRGYLLPYGKQCHEKYLARELDAMDNILKVSEECLEELQAYSAPDAVKPWCRIRQAKIHE